MHFPIISEVTLNRIATEGTRRRGTNTSLHNSSNNIPTESSSDAFLPMLNHRRVNWKRILLLIIAITVHNIPGTHAVGGGIYVETVLVLTSPPYRLNMKFFVWWEDFPRKHPLSRYSRIMGFASPMGNPGPAVDI